MTLACLLLVASIAACSGSDARETGGKASGADSATDSGGDTSQDSPTDTAVDCGDMGEPGTVGAPTPLTPGEPLCGGWLTGIGVSDDEGLMIAADFGTCAEVGAAGAVYAVAPGSDVARWMIGVPEATDPFRIAATRGGQGLLALMRTGPEGIWGGAIDVRQSSDGALLSHLTRADGELEYLDQFAFADGRLVVAVVSAADDVGVAVFAQPWAPEAYWRDAAVALHPPPDGTCCFFGQVLASGGDVTGDGLEDVLVMGGGAWVLDGELLLTNESPTDADALPVAGYASHDAFGGVGDIDGDGIGDISASTYSSEGIFIQVIAGGSYLELARLDDAIPDGYVSESVTGVGRLDGADADTMAVVWSAHKDMAEGGDQLWLVTGPLCGSWTLPEIGTQVELPSTAYITEVEGSDRFFVAIDEGEDGGYLFGEF